MAVSNLGSKQKHSLRFYFSAIVVFMNILVQGQNKSLSFDHFSVNEGLSQSTVFSIYQDNSGFLWFGTRTGGLNRYDGYSFKVYKNDRDDSTSISSNVILDILQDSHGVYWIATREGGLNRFDSDKEIFHSYLNNKNNSTSINHNIINDIFEDKNGNLWIGANKGLDLYNREQDNFHHCLKPDSSILGQVLTIDNAPDNNIWVGTKDNGLYLIDSKTGNIINQYTHDPNDASSLPSNYIVAVLYDSKGTLWIGTRNNGLSKLENYDSGVFINFSANIEDPTSISDNIIRTIDEDSKGNIWIGTKNGLDILNPSQRTNEKPEFFHVKHIENDAVSLNQNSIYSFLEDHDGDIWIGTWSGGVNYLNNGSRKFEHFKHIVNNNSSLSYDVVSSFAVSDDGYWIGTEGGGLNLFNREENTFKHFTMKKDNPLSLQSVHIKSLFVDYQDDLWVGTFNGLYLYNKTNKSFKQYLKGKSIYSIVEGLKGEIWIGCSTGLYKLDKSSGEYEYYTYNSKDHNTISNKAVNKILKDHAGEIWIGTQSGLNKYNREQNNFMRYLHNENDRNTVSHNHITALEADKNGNIWIGTLDGLNKLDINSGTFEFIGEKHGLPDNSVNNIIADDLGYIWITTNKGLTKLIADETSEEFKQNDSKRILRTYDVRDGLQGNEFIMNATYKTKNGEIFLGGINGFNILDPANIKINQTPPNVIITDFKLFNKPVEIGVKGSPLPKHISKLDEIILTHKQSVIAFEFVALNYNSPEKNQFAYKMEGLDDEWNYIGNRREANYTNLQPGEYTFRVKASNNDNVWNEEGTSLKIIVQPAWWQTLAFKIALFILIVSISILITRRRTKSLKEAKEVLESKVAKATQDIKIRNEKLNEAQKKLVSIIDDVKNELGKTSVELMEATNSQASTIEEISASIEQMARDSEENAKGAAEMFASAKKIEDDTKNSVSIVGQTVESIKDITQGIGFISEFARTTNLLSLNAAVEAARAGEHGRSFTVVASEVKRLADQSQKVAVDIQKLSEAGLSHSNKANEKITELQTYIKNIVSLIAQIRESSENQSTEANTINLAVQQMSNYISSTAQLAAKLDAAINSLSMNEN